MTIYRPIDNDFAEWAFGSGIWTDFLMWDKDVIDLLEAWNNLHPMHSMNGDMYIQDSMKIMNQLYRESKMDKKMHKVTEKMRTAEGAIKSGKKKAAIKELKGAEKSNEKLVKIDKDVRDPLVDKAKKMMKKGCK